MSGLRENNSLSQAKPPSQNSGHGAQGESSTPDFPARSASLEPRYLTVSCLKASCQEGPEQQYSSLGSCLKSGQPRFHPGHLKQSPKPYQE